MTRVRELDPASASQSGDKPPRSKSFCPLEPWQLISKKVVKGIPFVAVQWQDLKPPVAQYFKLHADEFDPAVPCFYVQHGHP